MQQLLFRAKAGLSVTPEAMAEFASSGHIRGDVALYTSC
jgi:hypothetical protein